ncbi:hypothetical protein ABPG77_006788 [Micractinium sp. CCAP 211/92]
MQALTCLVILTCALAAAATWRWVGVCTIMGCLPAVAAEVLLPADWHPTIKHRAVAWLIVAGCALVLITLQHHHVPAKIIAATADALREAWHAAFNGQAGGGAIPADGPITAD